MKTAIFNASLFRAAAYAQSTEETRFYLHGVFVEPAPRGGVLLTATDGNMLVNVWDANGSCSDPGIVALPPALLKECKAKRGETRFIRMANGVASVHNVKSYDTTRPYDEAISEFGQCLAVAPSSCMVDGTFPDWRRVIPRTINKPMHECFDAQLLATFVDVAAALANAAGKFEREHKPVISVIGNAGSPALVRFAGVANAFGVVMPFRETLVSTLPDYLQA